MKKFLKIMTILSGILMVLLILLYAAAMIFVNRKADSMMTSEMRADYEIFTKEKFQYDPADIYPEPFSDETIGLADAFMDEWEKPATQDAYTSFSEVYDTYCEELYKIEKAAFETTASLKATTTTLDDVEEAAKALRPLLDDWRQLIERDDYLSELFDFSSYRRNYAWLGYWQNIPSFDSQLDSLHYEALRCIDKKDATASLDGFELALWGMRNHRYTNYTGFIRRIRASLNYYPLCYRAVIMCDNTERLKKNLDFQRQMYLEDEYMPEGYHQFEYEAMFIVRVLSRFGVHKDIQGQTLMDISENIFFEWPQDYYEEVLQPIVPDDEKEEIAENFQVHGFNKLFEILYPFLKPILTKRQYYVLAERCYFDKSMREAFMNVQALSDILLLQTAARIYELEKGAFPESAEALVPDYLDTVPMDVYTDRKQPYLRQGSRWYSIGSDGTDDKMRTNALGYYQSGLRPPDISRHWENDVQPGDLFFGLPVMGE